jgi:[protein-PII] uridylyltransferase
MCAEAQAFLVDQLVRLIHDHVSVRSIRASNRSSGERLTIMAVGGYGRGEMAPHSDVDIAFLTPGKQTPWCEQVIEAMLYFLWDLALKVGHSSRSLDEMVRMAKGDLTIRTAMLEGRYVWGDQACSPKRRTGSGPKWWRDRAAIRHRKAGRAQRTAQAAGRQPLCGRAERQGGQGRPARSAHAVLDRQIHPQRPQRGELVDVGLLTRRNTARSARPRTSSGRCAATCTPSPDGPRTG